METGTGPNKPPERRTRHLLLRAPEPSDVDALFAIQGDPVAMRFTYCAPSRAATAARLEAYAARFSADGFAPWTALLAEDERVVGWGGLNTDPEAPGWGVEVAYFLSPSVWGRGFATELVQAALAHAFRDLGLSRVGAFSRPDNVASTRVLAKAGFARIRFVPSLERDEFEITAQRWQGAS